LVTTSSDLELALDTINNSLNTINTICSNNKIAIEEEVTARISKTESLDNEIELIKTNYATNTALSKHISNMTLDDNGN
jgi:ABC-type metal ion transport system substrate-binding protein